MKKFRNEVKGNSAVGSSTSHGSSSAPGDIEMGPIPSRQPQHQHPGGYHSLASFIGSDKDFFIFRRFSNLSARNLLYLQDELLELEAKLMEVDLQESSNGSPQGLYNLHTRREDKNESRKTLMKDIKSKLQEYGTRIYYF